VNKEKFNKKFGAFVSKKRIELGMTQSKLASLIGNNAQNISRLERGEVGPTLYWLTLLAKAFEMKLSELIKEFENLS
jgi:transcriptional regulator with XRE-family HTH domain